MMETAIDPESLDTNSILTQLIPREDLIAYSHHEILE
jgi:hypothetical protein